MKGRQMKYMEAMETIENLLHELEMKRAEEDLLNVDKYDYLYEMLYNLQKEILKLELQEGIK